MAPLAVLRSHDAQQLHGGAARTRQLDELYRNLGQKIVEIDVRAFTYWAPHGPAPALRYCIARQLTLRARPAFRQCRAAMNLAAHLRRSNVRRDVVIVEGSNAPGAIIASRSVGMRVVCIPQNIESLNEASLGLFRGRSPLVAAAAEVDFVSRHTSLILTISEEERFLFSKSGHAAETMWLPYIPPSDTMLRCNRVREKRLGRAREGSGCLLWLGTRQPSADADTLRFFRSLDSSKRRLRVAGLGTETYAQQGPWRHIEILGTLSHEDAENELVSCQALVVWNLSGAGSLTRIAEASLAGVPVYANVHALRSSTTWNGVHPIASHAEIPFSMPALEPGRGVIPEVVQATVDETTGRLARFLGVTPEKST